MSVTCASCQRTIQVPPDKAAVPNLKVKCRCGNVFAVASALGTAPASAAGPAAAAPPPTPAPAFTTVPPVRMAAAPPAATPPAPRIAAAGPSVAPTPPTTGARSASATPVPRPAVPPVPMKPANGEARGAVPAARPATAPAPAAARGTAAAAGTSASGKTGATLNWRRCANHPAERADSVCPRCMKGYCPSCVQVVQGGAICAQCDGLCVNVNQYEEMAQMARQRERPMKDDLELIITYPLRDKMGFVMLALFTWFFGLFSGMFPIAYLLSKGVLLWYTFYALSRVASGNLKDFMPDMRDLSDLSQPARLAFAAFLISTGPMILVTIFFVTASLPLGIGTASGPAPRAALVHAQSADEQPAGEPEAEEAGEGKDAKGGEGGSSASGGRRGADYEGFAEPAPSLVLPTILLIVTVAWKILYTPVALVVAALSRSFVSTINPVIGIWAIQKMGSVYWQCLGIYCVLAGSQWLLGLALGFIPIAGGFVAAFINAYAYLAIACTLGLGVFKKAPELGWD